MKSFEILKSDADYWYDFLAKYDITGGKEPFKTQLDTFEKLKEFLSELLNTTDITAEQKYEILNKNYKVYGSDAVFEYKTLGPRIAYSKLKDPRQNSNSDLISILLQLISQLREKGISKEALTLTLMPSGGLLALSGLINIWDYVKDIDTNIDPNDQVYASQLRK